MNKTYKNPLINLILLIIVLVGFGFWAGRYTSVLNNYFSSSSKPNTSTEVAGVQSTAGNSDENQLFQQVWNILHTEYYSKSLNNQAMYYGAIEGATAAIGDPVTNFYSPQQTQAFNNQISGDSFSGIGVQLGYDSKSNIIIESVLENTPASQAKVLIGYQLLAVNNETINNLTIDQVVTEIQGKTGTKVTITFLDPTDGQSVNITMTRAPITVASINVKNLGNGLVDINVLRFTDSSVQTWDNNWTTAVNQALSYSPKGIILDLRGNPGGYFDGAVYAAGSFLPSGTIVAYQEDRNGSKTPFYTSGTDELKNIKCVILVNGGTASAAEILSGALQQDKRATIVGENTYGKGTAQNIINFADGSSLHLTELHWLLPNQNWINPTNPIKPDDVVTFTTDQFKQGIDPQLTKGEQILKGS